MQNGTNIQDRFLNAAREARIPLTVYLTNGFQQRGTIVSFDGYTVLLQNDNKQHLIYKHAISTIIPYQNVVLHENSGEE